MLQAQGKLRLSVFLAWSARSPHPTALGAGRPQRWWLTSPPGSSCSHPTTRLLCTLHYSILLTVRRDQCLHIASAPARQPAMRCAILSVRRSASLSWPFQLYDATLLSNELLQWRLRCCKSSHAQRCPRGTPTVISQQSRHLQRVPASAPPAWERVSPP